MTKKQSKSKKMKKAVKPAKARLGKVAKSLQKVAKKKLIVKKTFKVAKKVVSPKNTLKRIQKGAAKKTVPEKKNKKSLVPIKSVKAVKENKSVKKEELQFGKKIGLDNVLIKPVRKSKGGRKRKNKNDDDDEPVIETDLLVEQLIQSTKRLRKPPKAPKQLRTFTNPMASLAVAKLPNTTKKTGTLPKKEPKGKFELEYVMHTSAGILYEFLTSPSGLAEWFADDVNIHEGIFTFFWEGSEQKAKLLGFKEDKYVRLQWLDKPDGTFFEFRIERDDLTGDVSLMVTDFADEVADLKTSKLLWDSQITKLLHVIGSY